MVVQKLPVVDRISLGLGKALSLLFLVAVALTVYEVVMRYAFNAPTIWVHDVVIVRKRLPASPRVVRMDLTP